MTSSTFAHSRFASLPALLAAALAGAGAQAAPAPAAAPATQAASAPITEPPPGRAEPAVQHVVIEDGGSRVEELRVRGQVRRITVTPKNGSKPYEIIPADGARDLSPGPGSTKGAAGQRVWNVFDF